MRGNNTKLRLAWFSIYGAADSPSPSAYLSNTLYPYLKDFCDFDFYGAEGAEFQGKPVFHYLTAFKKHLERPYDAFVYQIEDGKECYFARTHLALIPGVVLFHSYRLGTDGPEPILNSSWATFAKKFKDHQVAWPARDAVNIKEGREAKRESGMALVPVFFEQNDLRAFRDNGGERLFEEGGAYYLPIPVEAADASTEGVSVKSATKDSKYRVAFCGEPVIEYRSHKLLQALSLASQESLGQGLELHWLVQDKKASEKAKALVEEFGIKGAKITEGKSPGAWARLAAESDIAIHLHFGLLGALQPYLAISQMAGLPCLVSDWGEGEYVAPNGAISIVPGTSEATQIAGAIRSLIENGVTGRKEEFAKTSAEFHRADFVAEGLLSILNAALPRLMSFYRDWEKFSLEARQSLFEEVLQSSDEKSGGGNLAGFGELNLLEPVYKELGWKS